MKIHKQALAPVHRQTIALPTDAKIVAVQAQHDRCCLWYTTTGAPLKEEITIVCVNTGTEFEPHGLTYLGTCQFHSGHTVVHVFEEFPI